MPHHDDQLCMFCLRSDGGFESREHVVSESLGNDEAVLEAWVVCDRCNTGPLARCDKALTQCPPIKLVKAFHAIPSKGGRLPRAEFRGSGMYPRDRTGSVDVHVPDVAVVHTGPHSVELSFDSRWKVEGWRLISRSLLKAGLEFAALNEGKPYVMDHRFDGIRRAVIDGRYAGWLSHGPIDTDAAVSLRVQHEFFGLPHSSRVGLAVRASILGVRLATAWPPSQDVLYRLAAETPEYHTFDRVIPRGLDESVNLRLSVDYAARCNPSST